MITAIRNGKYVTRNISQFKKIVPDVVGSDDDTESEDDDEDGIPPQGNPQPNVFPRNPVHPNMLQEKIDKNFFLHFWSFMKHLTLYAFTNINVILSPETN